MAVTVPYKAVQAIKVFLKYLNANYSRRIDPNDRFLIAAIYAWWQQEGLSSLGNNPFNIRSSPFATGTRQSKHGTFAVFPSLAVGMKAAAYLLMHGGWGNLPGAADRDIYGYRRALEQLKKGGNEGAWYFLAAMAMSSWSGSHYGANTWTEANDPKQNHLLRNYVSIGGIQIKDPTPVPAPTPKPKKRKPIPQLPRDFNYEVVVRNYLDPWAVSALYKWRHKRPQS